MREHIKALTVLDYFVLRDIASSGDGTAVDIYSRINMVGISIDDVNSSIEHLLKLRYIEYCHETHRGYFPNGLGREAIHEVRLSFGFLSL